MIVTPEQLLAGLDRFRIQTISQDVEPRTDDTWAVVDTKTADPETNWPGELVSKHETYLEARTGMMAAVIEAATDPCIEVDLPHVVQLGTGAFIIGSGTYRDRPAVFIEPAPARREPGTRVAEGVLPADELAPGSTVITATDLRSLEVLREHIDKAATKLMRGAAPLTEDECFMVEAAMYYGFRHVDDDATVFQATESQIVALVKAAREQGRQDVLSLQPRCVTWLDKVTEDDPTDLTERLARFFEESTEFVQSKGFTEAQAHDIVRYVFGRPAGEPRQEIGGAMTTMAVLCAFIGEDMFACAEAELARVDTPEVIQKIREKRSRRHGRGVLPGTTEEADLVPAEKPYQAPFIGLPLSDGRMI